MKTYKTSKKPLIIIYAFLAALLIAVRFLSSLIKYLVDRYVPYSAFAEKYVLLPAVIIVGFFAVIVLPFYFFKARFTVSSKELTAVGGLIITTRTFLNMDAVKSVTILVLPLSRFTGFNFLVINTMGARVVLPFLSRGDAQEIFSQINSAIRSRGGAP